MERRRFLCTVAFGASAAGAGAVWLPGCGASNAPVLRAHEVDDLLGRLDRGLETVRAAPFGGVASRTSRASGSSDRVIRKGLEALVVADVARSIPPGTHLPRALASRLRETVPILDECVVAYHALLEQTPESMRRRLDEQFRAKPRTAMDVAEAIDGRAAQIGISYESRTRLRSVAVNVGTRIRRQSSSALIDDCVAKIENIVARSGADLHAARSATTTAMIHSIWQQVEGTWSDGLDVPPPPPGPGVTVPAPAPGFEPDWEVPPRHAAGPRSSASPGDRELEVGGILIGVGLGVFGIGGIVSLAMQSIWPVVIAATPAGIAVIVGLIFLIIGAAQNARA